MLIHDKFYDEGESKFDKFLSIVSKLARRQCVEFAFYCAKDVYHLVKDQDKELAKRCIDLVEKWLKDENSVTSEELNQAANASWVPTYSSNAAFASVASWATRAVAYAADAAYAAAYASQADADAYVYAYAYAYASSFAASCGSNSEVESNKFNEYLVVANSYFSKTTINCPNYGIEGKILYLIDELEENIIVHKDKYYANMNEIERCPEYGFSSQQELLEKLLYSEERFWEFTRNWLDRLYTERCYDV